MPPCDPLLTGTIWENWHAHPIAADASTRRYARLVGPSGETAILLQSDPARDDSLPRFLALARFLRENGLAAPAIHLADPERGSALLGDLGQSDFTDPDADTDALGAVLVRLDGLTPPPDLPRLDAAAAGEALRLVGDFYAPGIDVDRLAAVTTRHMAALTGPADRLALRDLHAENLIWRPEKTGLDRVGLLDFQDACRAPRGYDLASFLRDVRRDIPRPVAERMIDGFATTLALEETAFRAALAALGAQRNLRILGIFARLILRDGKDRYRQFLPRTWRLLTEDLSHPALAEWRATVQDMLPPPEKAIAP